MHKNGKVNLNQTSADLENYFKPETTEFGIWSDTVAKLIAKTQRKGKKETNKLFNHRTTLREWQKDTAKINKSLTTRQYLLGIGGRRNMTMGDMRLLADITRRQIDSIIRLGRDVFQGKLTRSQIAYRINQIARMSRISYEVARQRLEARKGARYMERSLGAVKHKHCAECLEYAGRGKVPLGGVPLPMVACSCYSNCKCSVRYYRD